MLANDFVIWNGVVLSVLNRTTLNEIIGGKLKVEQGITNGKIKLDGDSKY
ncbi:MAG: hypothetical protein KDJ54_00245 [Candidatus Competibacteraceae bacterium]|nr:hypothetical protein [Candidatus Competibacteraceae bacterium]